MKPVLAPYRSYVLISRGRLVRNFFTVRGAVGPSADVMAVVKADAYGHGAVEVSRLLVDAGARWLAVSSPDEGVALRAAGIRGPRILVMGGFLPHEIPAFFEYDLTPAVHSLRQVADLEAAAAAIARPIACHLKLDTGMHRLGLNAPPETVMEAFAAAPDVRLEGLMTHFASAADYTSPQTDEQLARFQAFAAALDAAGRKPLCLHASSTNAIGYGRRSGWHDLVRAGHALYGYLSPARGDAPPRVIDVRPALEWKAKILLVKDVPRGAPVGYGASFRAPQPMRIGIIGAGYADGVFHRLSNRGKMIAAGRLTPILGAVSMDLTTIDLSHAPHLQPGDDVTLLGAEGEASLDAQQIARLAGTISYNILCDISGRVRRVYVD